MKIMDMIWKKHIWRILIAIEAVILGIVLLFMLLAPAESYIIPIMSGTPDIGEIYQEGGYYTFDQDGDAAAALELDDYIPFHINLPVKKGSYTVVVDYKSSSYSTVRLFSSSDEYAVQCDDFMLYENQEQLTSNLIVKHDVEDMDICVKYGGYGWFDLRGITLQSNHRNILPLIIKWMMAFLVIDFLVWIRKRKLNFSNCEKLRVGFVLFSFSLIASLPMFVGFLPMMDDFAFSFVRIEGIKDAILEGQIPAVILPNSLLGYGYADPVFYPNILLYFPAVMRMIGFSFIESYKLFVFIMHFVTAYISYYAVKHIYHSTNIGLFGSFIYTFSIYRLEDIYRRSALGETWAIAFLPLIVYGLYCVLTEDTESKSFKNSWIPLTIGLWGVANTHLLSCEMVAAFVIPVCIICVRRVFTKARFLQLIKSVVTTLLLTMYFIVPFIDMSLRDSYKVYSREPMNAAENTTSLFETFSLFFSQVGSAVGFTEGKPPRDVGIGFVFLIGIILFLYIKCGGEKRLDVMSDCDSDKEIRGKFCWICLIFGCIAIWMTTYHFPWSAIGYHGGFLKKIAYMIQYPTRYTEIATVLLMFTICEIIYLLTKREYLRILGGFVITCFVLLISIQTLYYFQTVPREGLTFFYYEEAGLPMSGGNGYGEYEPSEFWGVKLGYNIWDLQGLFEQEAFSTEIIGYERSGTDAVLTVSNPTSEEQRIYLPTLCYPGYVAYDIFTNHPIQTFKSEKGTLGVIIPPKYLSAVKIEYHISWIYRVGEGITLIAILCLIVIEGKKIRRIWYQ